MTIRQKLVGEEIVKGNMNEALQVYNIYYYPQENKYLDKVWLYFNRKEGEKYLFAKSLCFQSAEQLKTFINNLIKSYLYLLEKRAEDYKPETMDIIIWRRKLLDATMMDLAKKQRGELNGR